MGYVGGSIILLNLGSTVFLIYRNKTETAPPTLRGRRGATNPSFRRPVFVATPRRAAAPRAPSVDREGPMKVVAGPLPPPRGLRDGRDRPGPDGPRRWRRRPRIWAAPDLIWWLARLGRVFGVLVVRVAIVRKQWCPVVTRGGLRCFRHRRPAFLRCQPWPAVVGRGWPAALAEAWPWPAVVGSGLAVAWPLSGCGRPWLGCVQPGPTAASRQLLLHQRFQSGVTLVVGPEGLAGVGCDTEVVLRVVSGLFWRWRCGRGMERATTMTTSGRQARCFRAKAFTS
jgi:hypothetical protein